MTHWLAVPVLPEAPWLLWLSVPFWVWVVSLRWRTKEQEAGAVLARGSWGGIALQAAGIALAGMGPLRRAAPGDPLALALIVVAALSLVGMVGTFMAARRELGRNWSFVARTRAITVWSPPAPMPSCAIPSILRCC